MPIRAMLRPGVNFIIKYAICPKPIAACLGCRLRRHPAKDIAAVRTVDRYRAQVKRSRLLHEQRNMVYPVTYHELQRGSYLSPSVRDRIVRELGRNWIAASELAAKYAQRGYAGLSEDEQVEICQLLPGSQNPFFDAESMGGFCEGDAQELNRAYRRAQRFLRNLRKALGIWREEGIDPFFPVATERPS